MGDFSKSGVNIYDPATAHANPNYNPIEAGKSQPTRKIRAICSPNNVIPMSRINPVAFKFLQNYVPQPNYSMGMMMGG